MGTRLSPKDQALYRAVDEVLHFIWDPIGISTIPQARDEYQGYLPHAFGLLRDGASAETIASCRIPDDHISIRSWKLAAARDVLVTLLTSLGVSKP